MVNDSNLGEHQRGAYGFDQPKVVDSSSIVQLRSILQNQGILIGRPIPRDFFETTGKGESDHQIHAGSYHFALQEAGIERANIMTYSSILPAQANKISKQDGMKQIVHGEEMKVIQACANVDTTTGKKRATAAIMYGWLYPKNGGPTVGGLVGEYNGHDTIEDAKANLRACIKGLYTNRDKMGRSFSDEHELRDIQFISETIEPTKKYGTALAALAFVNHFIPIIPQKVEQKPVTVEIAH